MSPAHRFLHSEGAGFTLPAPVKMRPAEIALTLSADVLRLPYTPATRLVLAEIVSLYAATSCCDASNPHFMARLSLKHDVVNEAIQRLHEDGMIVKVVNKAAGFYRTLTPVPVAIAAKAATNPYPEKSTTQSEKPTRVASRKNPIAQSENPTSPSRENPLALVGNPDTNTPFNIPLSFQEKQAADAAGAGSEDFGEFDSPTDASHTEGGAADVATSVGEMQPTDTTDRTDTGRTKPVGPRGWAYDPADLAENLRLPFDSAEFRAAWIGYRTYREEMKYRRLSGGMMEQQQLDKLSQLAAGDEGHALALIANAIGKGWQDFYPLDKPYATARKPSSNGRAAAGAGRVETLPTYGRNRGPQTNPTGNAS